MILRRSAIVFCPIALVVALLASVQAQNRPEPLTYVEAPQYGPYNGVFLAGGDGLNKVVAEKDPVLKADAPWTLFAWVNADDTSGTRYVAGIGDPSDEYSRYLALRDGAVGLAVGKDNAVYGNARVSAREWHAVAATFDGSQVRLYRDGAGAGSGRVVMGSVSATAKLAPPAMERHFGGRIAGFRVERRTLSAAEIAQWSSARPEFGLINFEEGSRRWPLQTRQQAGYIAPQDPATLPQSRAPFSKPVVTPVPNVPSLQQGKTENEWVLAGGWKLIEAPKLNAAPQEISRPGLRTNEWMAATVPGTVLTTMIDRGVYPDPDYGLNNLAIPESLNKQDYWYRNEFRAPDAGNGRRITLTFQGINYHADVWLNGKRLGDITGAFVRGVFDVSDVVKPSGVNVLAVRISPPPHPGIPQEQSIKGGPGENGGAMVIDGPTFVATEGWDWIPAIRDRNSGIWQPVTLTATDVLKIGDAQVVSTLPLPDHSRAALEITVPVENASNAAVSATLTASFEQTTVTKTASVPPGKSEIRLTAQEFPQLNVEHPRLWWPNGYGKPELYDLQLSLAKGSRVSDRKHVRFGIREISYELSLFDSAGNLRRVEYRPTLVRGHNAEVVDVRHEGMRSIPANDPFPAEYPKEWKEGWRSWVASLASGGEKSPAIHSIADADASPAPYLVIKVNGVRIAARGGNWGMDDSRKRVSREHLEPYFRLHRDANLNIIRNWVGQDTEETFYDLADEYGMMVWNDFWESTQDYNAEAQDPVLFLENARDTILRFRNHPSIIMWCGRNEGVPQPIINEGLIDLISKLDGTRYYSPSSNQVNLQNSGPYHYQDPTLYYTTLNHGFSVETGTPSFSTLEAFRASIAPADQWPLSDAWAYHDWHQSGNGDVATFTNELQNEFGAPTSLEDFERKAQMLNYVSHRAIFEGMNAHLWAPNSGRMLWMTQPAWPSNMWQIFSSDYDTHASYYGTKKACEPLHVQLDLSNYDVALVNTTGQDAGNVDVVANVYSLDNRPLLQKQQLVPAKANSAQNIFRLDLAPLLDKGVVLVKLEARRPDGRVASSNLYWQGKDAASYRQLSTLAPAQISATATSAKQGKSTQARVSLKNGGTSAALEIKLTLLKADGSRILPAYYSDNYVSLLPGETREISVEYPSNAVKGAPQIGLRGFNLTSATIPVSAR